MKILSEAEHKIKQMQIQKRKIFDLVDIDNWDKLIPIELVKTKISLIFEHKYENLSDLRKIEENNGGIKIKITIAGKLGQDHMNIIFYLTNFCVNQNKDFESLTFFCPIKQICKDLKMPRFQFLKKINEILNSHITIAVYSGKICIAGISFVIVDRYVLCDEKKEVVFDSTQNKHFNLKKKNLNLLIRFSSQFSALLLSSKQRKYISTDVIKSIAKERKAVFPKIAYFLHLNDKKIKKISLELILNQLGITLNKASKSKLCKILTKSNALKELGWIFDPNTHQFLRLA